METRSRRLNIILCRRLFPRRDIRRRFSQKFVRFILFLPLLFPMEVSVNVVGQRRGSTFFLSFLYLHPPPSIACPCRFIFVAKRNTNEVRRCLTARHAGSGWQLPSKCDGEFRVNGAHCACQWEKY